MQSAILDSRKKFIFRVDVNIICIWRLGTFITYTHRTSSNITQTKRLTAIMARVSTTLDQNLLRIQKNYYNEFKVTEQINLYTANRQPGLSTTLDQTTFKNASCQLGWGVHDFGRKSPYTNTISRQLGWGVHYFGQKKTHVQTYHAS